mmetsp:Transcript_90321/g.244835  ORF Transcript_90321/g.244835 Transcript_90321/m.244835 type:complete len:226 (-) Transcript_90321:266-943(-)
MPKRLTTIVQTTARRSLHSCVSSRRCSTLSPTVMNMFKHAHEMPRIDTSRTPCAYRTAPASVTSKEITIHSSILGLFFTGITAASRGSATKGIRFRMTVKSDMEMCCIVYIDEQSIPAKNRDTTVQYASCLRLAASSSLPQIAAMAPKPRTICAMAIRAGASSVLDSSTLSTTMPTEQEAHDAHTIPMRRGQLSFLTGTSFRYRSHAAMREPYMVQQNTKIREVT